MIRTIGKVGSDGTTIVWYFIVCYTGKSIMMPKIESHLNRKGAVTFFRKMVEREKKYDVNRRATVTTYR